VATPARHIHLLLKRLVSLCGLVCTKHCALIARCVQRHFGRVRDSSAGVPVSLVPHQQFPVCLAPHTGHGHYGVVWHKVKVRLQGCAWVLKQRGAACGLSALGLQQHCLGMGQHWLWKAAACLGKAAALRSGWDHTTRGIRQHRFRRGLALSSELDSGACERGVAPPPCV
jgi:hypothetical protein